MAVAQTQAVLAVMISIVKQVSSEESQEPQMKVAAKKAVSCTIGRLLAGLESIPQNEPQEQELKKSLVTNGSNVIMALAQQFGKDPTTMRTVLLPAFLSAVQMNVEVADPAAANPVSSALVGTLVNGIIGALAQCEEAEAQQQARLALTTGRLAFFEDTLTTRVQVLTSMMAREPVQGALGQAILASVMAAAFTELKRDKPDERALLFVLALALQHFKARASLEQRAALLRPVFTFLFTAMQLPALSAQTRTQAADLLYQFF